MEDPLFLKWKFLTDFSYNSLLVNAKPKNKRYDLGKILQKGTKL
ncbi:hypothetical protein MHD_08925 [Mannheimia granulomatis]|uniref:Uncharacterized protein n=1 Tax=Mannheimia granulomatis TaxID=85402 RepID=A0A011MG81_9PAST|nr:hypothetical protein AK33_10590 [Mannheimia granulomatis]RGE47615.1 hypothetical protein MHD_08925 [Mannheimia granulomatis]